MNTQVLYNIQQADKLRKQEEHIADLENTIRTLAKHLEAIQNIADCATGEQMREIRKHSEAFNILETITFVTKG